MSVLELVEFVVTALELVVVEEGELQVKYVENCRTGRKMTVVVEVTTRG